MDIWDKEKRSAVMAKIRSKDTKPELIVRRYLWSRGGWRYSCTGVSGMGMRWTEPCHIRALNFGEKRLSKTKPAMSGIKRL